MWSQIEHILAAEIGTGLFGKDGRMPSEAELAKRFDVNCHTVCRAMIGLAARGLVSVRQGRGTFAQPGTIDYMIGRRTRFSENLRQLHHTTAATMFRALKVSAEPNIAKALALRASSPVYQIEFLHESDGVALTFARNWYPARRFANLPQVLASNSSITSALAELGVTDYLRKWNRIGSTLPDPEVMQRLNINRQQPVLWVENVDVDLQGTPIKYGVTHFATDRVQLMVESDT
ncbi:MAG: Transcriptional regulator PhnF [uncultured Caballeronia sp.]|nr:MAG: Transcriptional regulator PhnF [uncultured Caballeronia sp.]